MRKIITLTQIAIFMAIAADSCRCFGSAFVLT